MSRSSKTVEFPSAHGTTLAARIEMPAGPVRAWALFAHCFTCSKDTHAAARISRALAEEGIAVLRFDFTGLGESEGEFASTNFSSNIEDVVCAADYLRTQHAAPAILIGHSLGGAAVLATANRIPETRAVATIGAPADPAHVTALLSESRQQIEESGHAEVTIGGRSFRIRRQFLDDIAEQPQRERIAGLGAALLVVHSPIDEIVGIDNARQIFEAARHPKSFVALDGADHLLTAKADAGYVAAVLAAWADRYALTTANEPHHRSADDQREPAEGLVRVAETGAGSYTQSITAGRHQLTADEPRPIGDDAGPNPYDLLLAALGSCTAMTVRMYADRKGWPLQRVAVELRHDRIHARDCADCETTSGKVDHIQREITIDGDLDTEQRRRLLEIADKCPVHTTLRTETVIATPEQAT